jgi:hypothetical protein
MENKNKPLEILGKEGFLDVTKEPNYGLNTLYTPGINNIINHETYNKLLKNKNKNKKNKIIN